MTRATMLALLGAILQLASGCYSPKSMDPAYLTSKPRMSVAVGKCAEKAQISDSGQGGLVGALVTSGRGGAMREAMSGIMGDTVKELIRQRFSEKMEEYFEVAEDGQLNTVIDIYQWGWYVPTTVAGIRTGSYQFILNGNVTITDSQLKKKSKIAYLRKQVTEAIGNKPTAEVSQEALLKCADKFAAEAVAFLVQGKAAQSR